VLSYDLGESVPFALHDTCLPAAANRKRLIASGNQPLPTGLNSIPLTNSPTRYTTLRSLQGFYRRSQSSKRWRAGGASRHNQPAFL